MRMADISTACSKTQYLNKRIPLYYTQFAGGHIDDQKGALGIWILELYNILLQWLRSLT